MRTQFTIKNFRIFDSDGADIDIKPITILTGTNSSGKSSIIKALVAMFSFWETMRQESGTNPFNCFINFADARLDLGGFDNVLNSNHKEDKSISFQYSVEIGRCGQRFSVEYRFVPREEDKANFGWLNQITIKNTKGGIVFQAEKDKDFYFDLTLFKEAYFKYIRLTDARHYAANCNIAPADSGLSPETIEWMKKEISLFLEEYHSQWTESERKIFSSEKSSSKRGDYCPVSKGYSYNSVRTLFPMPIWTILEGVSVNDSVSTLSEEYLSKKGKELPEDIVNDLKIVLDDCSKKGFSSLFDYFVSLEDNEGLFNDTKRYGEAYLSRFDHDSFCLGGSFLAEIEGQIAIVRNEAFLFEERGHSVFFDDDFNIVGEDNDTQKDEKYREDREESRKLQRTDIHFKFVHDTLASVSHYLDPDFRFTHYDQFGNPYPNYENPYYACFCKYVVACFKDALFPDFSNVFQFIGSDRAPVRRLYSARDDRDSFSKILLEYNSIIIKGIKGNRSKSFKAGSFVNKWLQKFGIADALEIENVAGGLGLIVYLVKHDNRRVLLADEGYGITQLLSILLSIETYIIQSSITKIANSITIAVEEPEIHLHPDYQSLLTDMFLDAYQDYNIHFIIETHSEYLVRRSQVYVAQRFPDLSSNPFGILYIPKDKPPFEMVFSKDGYFENKFGPGFYDAAGSDALTLSRLARKHRNE